MDYKLTQFLRVSPHQDISLATLTAPLLVTLLTTPSVTVGPQLIKRKVLANCFCPTFFFPYSNSPRKTPNGGCYLESETIGNYRLAENKCKITKNAFVAFDESYNKTVFLSQLFQQGLSNFWIGLTWDHLSYSWEWSNETPLGSYQPWFGGSTPTGSSNLGCVYVNTNKQWVAADCRNSLLYVCEVTPCDSLHYCP